MSRFAFVSGFFSPSRLCFDREETNEALAAPARGVDVFRSATFKTHRRQLPVATDQTAARANDNQQAMQFKDNRQSTTTLAPKSRATCIPRSVLAREKFAFGARVVDFFFVDFFFVPTTRAAI